jgi:uncharacterized protein YeaO (DUF488 family)
MQHAMEPIATVVQSTRDDESVPALVGCGHHRCRRAHQESLLDSRCTSRQAILVFDKEPEAIMIRTKRIYEPRGADDGQRFLVERLWPRGMSKAALHMDGWLKDVGPSTTLRRWYNHDPAKWDEFRKRYFTELDQAATTWQPLLEAARSGNVTLLYSAHGIKHNNAVALLEYLEMKLGSYV